MPRCRRVRVATATAGLHVDKHEQRTMNAVASLALLIICCDFPAVPRCGVAVYYGTCSPRRTGALMGLASAAAGVTPPKPSKPPPTYAVLRRLAQSYGNLTVHEPTGHAKWQVLRQKVGKDGEEQRKLPPWRMLRYLVWKTPPLRLLLVSDNLPDSQVGRFHAHTHSPPLTYRRTALHTSPTVPSGSPPAGDHRFDA